jgi:hypothetical protein
VTTVAPPLPVIPPVLGFPPVSVPPVEPPVAVALPPVGVAPPLATLELPPLLPPDGATPPVALDTVAVVPPSKEDVPSDVVVPPVPP